MNWRSSRRSVGEWTESTRAVRCESATKGSLPGWSPPDSARGRSLSRKVDRLWMAFLPAKAAKEGVVSEEGCLLASRQDLTRKARDVPALSSQWLRRSTHCLAVAARRPEAMARRQAKAPAARRQSSSSTPGGTTKGTAAAMSFFFFFFSGGWSTRAAATTRTRASAALELRRRRDRLKVASHWRSTTERSDDVPFVVVLE
mmetsp:Transcript_25866/g.83773  ORF Transcript_25866/g.83773 Transcript_25866/m.83773 type:complete len:201 (+) Transcript_25866:369-971(+)